MGLQVWPIYPSTKSLMRNIKEFRCAGFECQWAMFFSSFFFILRSFFFFKSGNRQILSKFTIPVFGHYSSSHKALSLLTKRGAIRQRLWLSKPKATSVKANLCWPVFVDFQNSKEIEDKFLDYIWKGTGGEVKRGVYLVAITSESLKMAKYSKFHLIWHAPKHLIDLH